MQEELRRVLVYHKWKASWWLTRCALRTGDASILSGVSGYANKQAAISEHMGNQCASYWLPRLESKGITPSWAAEYLHLANASRSGVRDRKSVV